MYGIALKNQQHFFLIIYIINIFIEYNTTKVFQYQYIGEFENGLDFIVSTHILGDIYIHIFTITISMVIKLSGSLSK